MADPRTSRVVLGVALAGQVGLTFLLLHLARPSPWLPVTLPVSVVALAALAGARLRRGATVALVLGVAALLQLIALTRPPLTSGDDLRYIWDAKVQLAGVDPYRYAPDSPALDRLHEPLLFTADCARPDGCARLNRPAVHTVYPPVAQGAFVAIRLLSAGGHGGQFPYQLAAALGVLAIAGLLVRRALQRDGPVWPVAAWAWSPVVVSEFGNNAHIDWLAVLLSLAGLGAYVAARPRWAGALVGAAIATKLYPALLLPSLLRRHPARVLACAVAVVAVGYLPHVLAVGTRVIGYLPGYLNEEGYSSGSRLLLLGRVFPHPFDTGVGALVLLALAVRCYRHADPDRPEESAVGLVGAAFLVATPNYGWYAALLIALIVMSRRWEWLPVAFAPTCTYLYTGSTAGGSLIYLAAAVLAVAGWRVRLDRSREAARGTTRPSSRLLWTVVKTR